MSRDDQIKRRNVLRKTSGAVAAASGLAIASGNTGATHNDCVSCEYDADLVSEVAAIYDSCDGEDTGWDYPLGTCLNHLLTCEVDCGWFCTEYYYLVEHEQGGEHNWIHEDDVREWCN